MIKITAHNNSVTSLAIGAQQKRPFFHDKYKEAVKSNTEQSKSGERIPQPNTNALQDFDNRVANYVQGRFKTATDVMNDFVTRLNIPFGNVIICSGNHDVLRPLSVDEDAVTCKKGKDGCWKYDHSGMAGKVAYYFNKFLNDLQTANCTDRCTNSSTCIEENCEACIECGEMAFCSLDDMNVLILNTNWPNPKKQQPGYYCVHCNHVLEAIRRHSEDAKDSHKLNVIIAHKPVYEICEKARLSFKRYTKTTFFSALQGFVGDSGIYLCGDKHTRSIVSSLFHDIPHYISGEPIRVKEGHVSEVEYNLLAISNGHVDMKRKLHLSYNNGTWSCEVRPQDDTVKDLYKLSQKYINKKCFKTLGDASSFSTWEGLCQVIHNWKDNQRENWYTIIDQMYTPICRYRINGEPDSQTDMSGGTIFEFVQARIIEQMKHPPAKNVLNIRGEHSAGKSVFLEQFYIHLMTENSKGSLNFIPAYFDMENEEIYYKIESGVSYCNAVREAFSAFVKDVQEKAVKEHQPVCYLIDGLDELDCWSYSTEDSVGRELLNTLAKYDNAWYVMAFSQHNLPCFKDTMPLRKYNDISDIMYFNPVDVKEENDGQQFTNFVQAYLQRRQFSPEALIGTSFKANNVSDGQEMEIPLKDVCEIIRLFRRLTINPGFLAQHDAYLTEINTETGKLRHKNENISDVYNYYIDRQHELCIEQLGYGFVEYAPAMAYLFSYKGYTYEKFKHLHMDNIQTGRHILGPICNNSKNVYQTFLFILKNRDAREYLVALHYNRELRHYVEHPAEDIEEDSILNEFITRNIAVLIRKLWRDTNKFVIACEQLLQRKDLSNCAQSMLIYCLSHLQMYEPIRNRLQDKMFQKGKETLIRQGLWDDTTEQEVEEPVKRKPMEQSLWTVSGENDAEKLIRFQQLSLKHSIEVFELMAKRDLQKWEEKYKKDEAFCAYNRQFQMLYYGDLSIKGDANIHVLVPGSDLVYTGFDFHDCFNYLYVKLRANRTYPLRAYDLFTICDLLISRLKCEHRVKNINKENTFFTVPKTRKDL